MLNIFFVFCKPIKTKFEKVYITLQSADSSKICGENPKIKLTNFEKQKKPI